MQKACREEHAATQDAERKINVDVHFFCHSSEFDNPQYIDDKKEHIEANGVYENTPC